MQAVTGFFNFFISFFTDNFLHEVIMRRNLFLLGFFAIIVMASGCDDDKTPDYAVIRGTITFENVDEWATWQDSGQVDVGIWPAYNLATPSTSSGWGAYPANFYFPGSAAGLAPLNVPAFDSVLARNGSSTTYDYSFRVEPGTYSAVAVGFRHSRITDPSTRTASLGVHWGMPDSVSHGIVVGPFNYPGPTAVTVEAGDVVDLDFKADFGFVNVWFQ